MGLGQDVLSIAPNAAHGANCALAIGDRNVRFASAKLYLNSLACVRLRWQFRISMHNFAPMCGRVYVKSTLADMVSHFSFSDPAEVGALGNTLPRYNGAPTQDYPIIIVDELARGSTMFVSAAGVSSQKPAGW